MTEKQITTLLKSMKDRPEFGGGFSDSGSQHGWERIAADIGIDPDVRPRAYGIREYVEFFLLGMQHQFSRVTALGTMVFLLVFGGSITTVNASLDTVPGDRLYPVKLATERMQVSMAGSERRATLHAEFASRRLDEVALIQESDRDKKEDRVKVAVERFKQEIAHAQTELAEIQVNNPERAAGIAVVLNRKADEYEATLETQENDEDVSEAVEDARGKVEEVNQVAISALVESHEAQPAEKTQKQLEDEYQAELKDIQTDIAFNQARLQTVTTVSRQLGVDAYGEDIEELRVTMTSLNDPIATANDTIAAGGYRRAFEIIEEIKSELSDMETKLVELELELANRTKEEATETEENQESPAEQEGADSQEEHEPLTFHVKF